MKVTVCQLHNNRERFEQDWAKLVTHTAASQSELVLLPEMPFSHWLAGSREDSEDAWRKAMNDHAAWSERISELGTNLVFATQPVLEDGHRYNQILTVSRDQGILAIPHRKQYLPNETGFWEANWYSRGSAGCESLAKEGLCVGFAICTELWFYHRARQYSKDGVNLLLSPRATYQSSTDKWIAGGRAAAVVSGAFSLSSNFCGSASDGEWGGAGWIIDPEEGDVLGVTSKEQPFLTLEIDLDRAKAAKQSYPRYVIDEE